MLSVNSGRSPWHHCRPLNENLFGVPVHSESQSWFWVCTLLCRDLSPLQAIWLLLGSQEAAVCRFRLSTFVRQESTPALLGKPQIESSIFPRQNRCFTTELCGEKQLEGIRRDAGRIHAGKSCDELENDGLPSNLRGVSLSLAQIQRGFQVIGGTGMFFRSVQSCQGVTHMGYTFETISCHVEHLWLSPNNPGNSGVLRVLRFVRKPRVV